MELRHLRYFVAVAELGSFSRAATRLFIAQPPLSTQVKQLEEEVGTPLLVRHPRGVRPTAAGTLFLQEAKDVLARVDNAKRIARQHESGGFLRVGYVPSAGHIVLPSLLRRLRAANAKVEIDVAEMITARQIEALHDGEVDVCYARIAAAPPEDLAAVLLNDPFCLAIPDRHTLSAKGPIDLRAAEGMVFVSYTRYRGPAFFDQVIGLCTDAGFSPNIRYEASTLFGVIDLVSAGLGVALVPASSAAMLPKAVTLRALRKPSRASTLACIHRRQDPNPVIKTVDGLTKVLFDEIRSTIRAHIKA
jgi:DNA-binding transcriptional LysR family regulator